MAERTFQRSKMGAIAQSGVWEEYVGDAGGVQHFEGNACREQITGVVVANTYIYIVICDVYIRAVFPPSTAIIHLYKHYTQTGIICK